MAANTFTTTDLVSDVQLFGHIPLGNSTFTASEILRIATFELQTPIMKQILSSRGGYYLTYQDYTTDPEGEYVIPGDAIAGALANIELIQSTTIIPVNQIEESEQFSTTAPTSTSYGFFMRGNTVKILPTPNIGTTRLWFFRRPSDLVTTSSCAQVTAIASNVISVSSLPSTFLVDTVIDGVTDQPPFNDLGEFTITGISGTDVTLDSVPVGMTIGDWLCLDNQTCIPQVPVEWRPILVQRCICTIYELQGYLDKLREALKKLEKLEEDTLSLITPRVQSQSKIINPGNGGFLSGRNGFFNQPAGREL